MVNSVGNALETGPHIKEIGFTPHDLKHHCKDMYNILEKMLPNEFYAKYKDGENLFILLVSVLFHDIGMTTGWTEEVRNNHSQIGKDMILKPYRENKDELAIKQELGRQTAQYVADIVYAHSDIKNDNHVVKETFKEILNLYTDMEYETKGDYEMINVPFLAAVLRLADELDISYERIEKADFSYMQNLPESDQHFKICRFFNMIQKGKNEDTLVITVNDDEYQKGNEFEKSTTAAQIIERYNKIQKEFRMLKDSVLFNTAYASAEIWKIKRICLENEELFLEQAKKKRIKIDSDNWVKEIIIKKNLFKSGHFKIDESCSARDWIDLDGLFRLDKEDFINHLAEELRDYIAEKNTIIGINYYGAILAAILGYKFKKSFAYFFDGNETVDSLEREIHLNDQQNIVLIIDVVVFGDALQRVTESLFRDGVINEEKGVEVIILFERLHKRRSKEILSKVYSNRFVRKIYTLDDSFDIEICRKKKEECIFRQQCERENTCDK